MLKPFILLIAVSALASDARAQRGTLNAYLKDSITHLPVTGATISNAETRKSTKSDYKGFFRLQVHPNDLIYIVANGYRYDTLRYATPFMDTVTLYLPPAGIVLENVTVTSGYQKYQLDSSERRREFEEEKGTSNHTVSKNHEGFGLYINLDRFEKKRYRDKVKAEQDFNRREKEAYIDFRFSPLLVSTYTGLKGVELLDFMQQYRPSYEWLRQHTGPEDLLDYINSSIKEYNKRKKQTK